MTWRNISIRLTSAWPWMCILMGEGCIDIPTIRGWVEEAGFNGFNEVEIFSKKYWAMEQEVWLEKVVNAYRASV